MLFSEFLKAIFVILSHTATLEARTHSNRVAVVSVSHLEDWLDAGVGQTGNTKSRKVVDCRSACPYGKIFSAENCRRCIDCPFQTKPDVSFRICVDIETKDQTTEEMEEESEKDKKRKELKYEEMLQEKITEYKHNVKVQERMGKLEGNLYERNAKKQDL